MAKTISKTFKNRSEAEDAMRALERIGVGSEQISLIVSDEVRRRDFRAAGIEDIDNADEGALAGAGIGGVAGAVLSVLATASALTIPGLNLVVAGPLVAALAGLGAGGIAGGLVGGLIGAGIPESEAKTYEKALKDGNVLLAVEPTDDAQRAQIKEVFANGAAYNVAA